MDKPMLNPKHQRHVNRLEELISEGKHVSNLESGDPMNRYIKDNAAIHSFLTKTENILASVFGKNSTHYAHYQTLTQRRGMQRSYEVDTVIGVLLGAKDDLENGFLVGQEFLIASEIFDSVLEQAKHLNSAGYKDPAAVLSRVVLEDALKRLARENGIDDSQRAASINDMLRQAGTYPQPQWRLIQACLDVGNAAAHGNFNNYNQEDVKQRIEDIERFLAAYFVS
jgi:HEPN domain-containing protein